jgi:hypothetical protein
MTDKPKLKDLLKLPGWEQLKVVLCAEIQAALGEKGPWAHDWIIDLPGNLCKRCGISRETWVRSRRCLCPVPHPITDPPEVVIERLLSALKQTASSHIVYELLNASYRMMYSVNECSVGWQWWWFFIATPAQRVLVCLLALEKIEE